MAACGSSSAKCHIHKSRRTARSACGPRARVCAHIETKIVFSNSNSFAMVLRASCRDLLSITSMSVCRHRHRHFQARRDRLPPARRPLSHSIRGRERAQVREPVATRDTRGRTCRAQGLYYIARDCCIHVMPPKDHTLLTARPNLTHLYAERRHVHIMVHIAIRTNERIA